MTQEEALKALNDVWYVNHGSRDAKDRLEALINSHFEMVEKVERVEAENKRLVSALENMLNSIAIKELREGRI